MNRPDAEVYLHSQPGRTVKLEGAEIYFRNERDRILMGCPSTLGIRWTPAKEVINPFNSREILEGEYTPVQLFIHHEFQEVDYR
jgi:hypothetical protein